MVPDISTWSRGAGLRHLLLPRLSFSGARDWQRDTEDGYFQKVKNRYSYH